MAIDLKSLQKNRAKAPRILIHGGEGVGKTTFACSAPSPVVIDLESGLGVLEVPHVQPDTYIEVLDVINALIEQEHDYKTVVIDSLDALESMITIETCTRNKWSSISEPAYGRGYAERTALWTPLWVALDKLRDVRNVIIIMIAHSQIVKVEDPVLPAFDKHTPHLYKTETAKVTEWPDVVGYAMIKTYVTADPVGKSEKVARCRATSAGERVLLTTSNPAYTAKSRYPMPEEIPLVWDEFVQYLKNPLKINRGK